MSSPDSERQKLVRKVDQKSIDYQLAEGARRKAWAKYSDAVEELVAYYASHEQDDRENANG